MLKEPDQLGSFFLPRWRQTAIICLLLKLSTNAMGESLNPQAYEAKISFLKKKMLESALKKQGPLSAEESSINIALDESALDPAELLFWQEYQIRREAEKAKARGSALSETTRAKAPHPSLEEQRAVRDREISVQVEKALGEHNETGAEILLQSLVTGKDYLDVSAAIKNLEDNLVTQKAAAFDPNNFPLTVNPVFKLMVQVAGVPVQIGVRLNVTHFDRFVQINTVEAL